MELLFAPLSAEIYPDENLTWIIPEKLGEHLCGQSRPDHFRGVATVVAKLFNIIAPDNAYFGQKDAQQLAIIKQMVRDLNFPIDIVAGEIIREKDGLAMSSRNVYLSARHREEATWLQKSLIRAEQCIQEGEKEIYNKVVKNGELLNIRL